MKIAFVEARQKTPLFEAISGKLHHEACWLIQNRSFRLSENSNQTILRYPSRHSHSSQNTAISDVHERVLRSDRVVQTFGRKPHHYDWYSQQIESWLENEKPSAIFGDPGSFHAHITALLATRRNIPFLVPSSSRYPSGRFAFFQSDRMVPVGGSGEVLPPRDADAIISSIVAGEATPDYMRLRSGRHPWAARRAQASADWLRGERYTGQSPTSFATSSLRKQRLRRAWNNVAKGSALSASSARPRILFPLQLQPELNLDVWGWKFRDQTALAVRLAETVESMGGELWIKPNPKSSYELSRPLLDLVQSNRNVFPLATDVHMLHVIDEFDLVVTVSGSVAIERLLARRPVQILLDDYAEWLGAPLSNFASVDEAARRLKEDPGAGRLQECVSPRKVLSRLTSTSYEGQIAEPDFSPSVLSADNVSALAVAFDDVLGRLDEMTL